MAWIFLIIAGIFEVCFATFLGLSDNFRRFWPTVLFIVFSALSFFFMSLSLKQIPIGTAYAVWTGIGACGVAIVGVLFFGDPLTPLRLLFLGLLIGSVIGLKFISH